MEKTIKNEFGETWTALSSDNDIYKKIEKLVIKKMQKSHATIAFVAKVTDCEQMEEGDVLNHYIACIRGGLNGEKIENIQCKWSVYFNELSALFKAIGHAWMIDNVNDCVDDLWEMRFAFTI